MSSTQAFSESRKNALIFFGLIVFSLLFYARATQFGFISFDDPTVLLAHPSLYDETSFVSGARAIFNEFPREEPLLLRDLSWAADARVFGFEKRKIAVRKFAHQLVGEITAEGRQKFVALSAVSGFPVVAKQLSTDCLGGKSLGEYGGKLTIGVARGG